MNVELGWRMASIAPLATAQHFSLFIFHYSLPKGTTFHFSLFTFHLNNGLRCDGRCSVLREPLQRAAFFIPRGTFCPSIWFLRLSQPPDFVPATHFYGKYMPL